MKIYINKLPKNCLNCPCHSRDFEEGDRCNLGAFNYNTCDYDKIDEDNYKHKDCPLIDIKTHDREIVKEVCEKIEDWCNKNFNWVGDGTGYDGQDYNEMIGFNNAIRQLNEFLNEIQKEYEK